ncbi:MAG: hypothetical protein AAF621_02235 [Pseudomonadota bacterium]
MITYEAGPYEIGTNFAKIITGLGVSKNEVSSLMSLKIKFIIILILSVLFYVGYLTFFPPEPAQQQHEIEVAPNLVVRDT